MSPIYLVFAGGAILYLLSKRAKAAPPPPPPSEELPLTPEEGGDVVEPEEPTEPPVGTIAGLQYPVQTPAGFVTHFEKDERAWNGRKASGALVIGTSFLSLDLIKADGRFRIASITLPPGYFPGLQY